jgi:predicted ATP-grasp superfamily ATP-dependent carboligase
MQLLHGIRVLVTDGHMSSALAVVRSLAAQGAEVTVVGERGRNFAGHSRFAARAVACDSPQSRPAAFADQLALELKTQSYDLLIPATEPTMAVVAAQRSRFESLVRLAMPPAEQLEMARDKSRTIKAARAAGVTVPRSWMPESPSDLDTIAQELSYPCVIKPRYSGLWTGVGPIARGTVRYAKSASEFRTAYQEIHLRSPWPVVQELVSGTGIGVSAITEHGTPLAIFAHRRVREMNPTGGPASLAESLAPSERLVRPAVNLLRAIGWHGVAMVEFKDPGDGRPPILMEINGRLWGSLPLAIAAGIDFPVLLACQALGIAVRAAESYRAGVQCRSLRGDLSHLVGVLKGRPAGWNGPFPSRLSTFWAVAPFPGRQWTGYTFRMSDPVPGVLEAWEYVRSESRGLRNRVKRSPRTAAVGEAG